MEIDILAFWYLCSSCLYLCLSQIQTSYILPRDFPSLSKEDKEQISEFWGESGTGSQKHPEKKRFWWLCSKLISGDHREVTAMWLIAKNVSSESAIDSYSRKDLTSEPLFSYVERDIIIPTHCSWAPCLITPPHLIILLQHLVIFLSKHTCV